MKAGSTRVLVVCFCICWSVLLPSQSSYAANADLLSRLQDSNVKIRRSAARELMKAPPISPQTVEIIIRVLKTESDDQVKYFLLEGLGRIGPSAKDALPEVIKALRSPDHQVRQSAAWSIGKMGHEGRTAAGALINALSDSEKDVRRTAAWALAITGGEPKAATPALVEALGDSDVAARQTAARALGLRGIDINGATAPLIKTLDDRDPEVRKLSAIALATFATRLKETNSTDATESLRSIQVLLEKNSDSDVRDQAATVAKAIEQLTKPPQRSTGSDSLLIGVLGAIASVVVILAFLYTVFFGARSIPEVLRRKKAPPNRSEKFDPHKPTDLLITSRRLTAIACNEKATKIACGGFGQIVKLLDRQTGTAEIIANHEGIIRELLWIPGEEAVVSTGDDGFIRVTYPTSNEYRPIGQHDGPVYSLAILNGSPNALVSGGKDGTVRIWDLTGVPIHRAGMQLHHRAVARATLDHNGACVFGVDSHRSGKWIASATAGGGVYIWEVATRLKISLKGITGACFCVRFSPTSEMLAACGADNTVKLWLLAGPDRKPRVFSGHLDSVRSIDFHPSGRLLLSASKDRTLRVWDCSSGQSWVLEGHSDYVYRGIFHPDGIHCLSVSGDGTLKLWQLPEEALGLAMRGVSAASMEAK